MSYKIICYGDSNTYGACGFSGGRQPKETRWTGILADNSYFDIVNYGENGREIPTDRWELGDLDEILTEEAPFDLFTVMLGTNDLLTLCRSGVSKVTLRMENLLKHVLQHPSINEAPSKILLIAPPPTALSRVDPFAAAFDRSSEELGRAYSSLAGNLNIHFADAGQWDIELGTDGVHFTAKGHLVFAKQLRKILEEIIRSY